MAIRLSPEQEEDILMQGSVMDEPRSMLQRVLDFAWGRSLPEQATSAFTGALGTMQPAWKLTKNAPSWLRRAFEGGEREIPLTEGPTIAEIRRMAGGPPLTPPTSRITSLYYELPESSDELAQLLEQLGGSYHGTPSSVRPTPQQTRNMFKPQQKPPPVSGGVDVPIAPGFAPYLKQQAAITDFSHDLKALRDSPVRKLGFARSSQQASYTYLKSLRRLVEKKAPDKLKLVDDAIDAVYNDDFSNAAMRSEQAVGYLHMDEIAEMRALKELGTQVLKLGKEISRGKMPPVSGGAPSMFEKFKGQ